MFEFKMPRLGADMDEGILLEWKVQPGDQVHKGDIVAVVDTSKGAIDIEVFIDGVVDALLVQPDSEVAVGSVIAHLQTADVSLEAAEPEKVAASVATAVIEPQTVHSDSAAMSSRSRGSERRISPRAQRLARQLQVDLMTIQGTGPDGSIIAEDIQAAAETRPARLAEATLPGRKKETTIRHAIAAAMSRSKREIPHYYLAHEVDVSGLLDFVQTWNDGHSVSERLLPAVFYYKAIGMAAAEFESMNGYFLDGSFRPADLVNLGVAISLRGGGLMAPCLMDMARKSASELMQELKDLVQRTRKGGLRASEMSEGTITVSNLGDRGVDFLAGVIYPPQVALVGVGSARQIPLALEGEIRIGHAIQISLAADHRVSDGHTGAMFLRRIAELLSFPDGLI